MSRRTVDGSIGEVQIRLGPSERRNYRSANPCPLGHQDLSDLNRRFAARVRGSDITANPTPSSLFSHCSTVARAPQRGASTDSLRGAAAVGCAAVTPSISPRNHAREARELPSGQLGEGEERPAPEGPEPAPARAFCCGLEVRVHEVAGQTISLCVVCGLRSAFRFFLPPQKRLPEA
jgi:hypothetical protein